MPKNQIESHSAEKKQEAVSTIIEKALISLTGLKKKQRSPLGLGKLFSSTENLSFF